MQRLTALAWIALSTVSIVTGVWAQSPASNAPGPVPAAVRDALNLSPFYKKHVDAKGLPILGSDKASDAALLEAAEIVNAMLGSRDDIRRALIQNRVRVVVMAPSEVTTDVPEHSDLTPKDYWDRRARGLGATRIRPATSAGAENLLNLPGDPYAMESILIHEFAHTIHNLGLNSIDPMFDRRLRVAFLSARDKGLWANTYAATNHNEYWAEAVQSYFDSNDANNPQHNDINTREKLANYDRGVFNLVDEAFAKNPWRYVRYDARNGLPSAPRNVRVKISNRTGMQASIYWSGPAGFVLYRTLSPGESYDQQTFVGHKWQARFPAAASIDFVAPATGAAAWTLN